MTKAFTVESEAFLERAMPTFVEIPPLGAAKEIGVVTCREVASEPSYHFAPRSAVTVADAADALRDPDALEAWGPGGLAFPSCIGAPRMESRPTFPGHLVCEIFSRRRPRPLHHSCSPKMVLERLTTGAGRQHRVERALGGLVPLPTSSHMRPGIADSASF